MRIGSKINELKVLSYDKKPDTDKYKDWKGKWVKCKCSCGAIITVPIYTLEKGLIKSCGHLKGELGGNNLKEYYKDHPPSNINYVTINGETKSITEWSKISGIPRSTLIYRINKNYPEEDLLKKENKNVTK